MAQWSSTFGIKKQHCRNAICLYSAASSARAADSSRQALLGAGRLSSVPIHSDEWSAICCATPLPTVTGEWLCCHWAVVLPCRQSPPSITLLRRLSAARGQACFRAGRFRPIDQIDRRICSSLYYLSHHCASLACLLTSDN